MNAEIKTFLPSYQVGLEYIRHLGVHSFLSSSKTSSFLFLSSWVRICLTFGSSFVFFLFTGCRLQKLKISSFAAKNYLILVESYYIQNNIISSQSVPSREYHSIAMMILQQKKKVYYVWRYIAEDIIHSKFIHLHDCQLSSHYALSWSGDICHTVPDCVLSVS